MTTPITDEEIAADCPAPQCLKCRFVARIRSDAATIAELRGQVAERDATIESLRNQIAPGFPLLNADYEKTAVEFHRSQETIARLRAVARAAQLLADTLENNGRGLYQVVNHGTWDTTNKPDVEGARDRLRRALSVLAPGDLGEGA